MTRRVSANFAPHFAPSPAPVAQWIEQRFPKPQVACSTHAGGANEPNFYRLFGGEFDQNSRDNRFFDTRSLVISATFDIR